MKISTIIPTFNRLHFLERAISSVTAQTKKVDEIIVVDNGSTDETGIEILKNFPEIEYIFEPSGGVSTARNTGIRNASHDWIALLDSDDEWKKNKIELFDRHFKKNGTKPKIWHSEEIWIRDGKYVNQKSYHKKKGGNLFADCLEMCCISPSSSLIHKDIFKNHGYFDESMEVCEDYDLWLRICSKEEIGFMEENLVVKHGGHSDQLSKKFWGMDRFRVLALIKLARTNRLTHLQKIMVKQAIIRKLEIIINGAEKRDNQNILEKFAPILHQWLDVSVSDDLVWF